MPIRAEQLEASLAKSLAPLYVIHGDEPLISLESADAIRAAARRKGFDDRRVLIAERGFDWSELRDAGASLSLFGGRTIVELRIPNGKPGTQGAEAIVAYCGNLNPENLTVVSLPRLDKAGQSSAWFGALSGAGTVVDVWPVDRARLPEWIGNRLARQKQRASREQLEFLADRVEGNLLAAHQEVQKLALLAPEGPLPDELLYASVGNVARYTPQDASSALMSGDTARYARVLDGLRGEGEALTFILWVVSEDIRAVQRVQAGLGAGRALDQLLRENRVWGPRQNVVRGAVQRFGPRQLQSAVLACAAIDRAVKGASRDDPWDLFLRLGLNLRAAAGKPSARTAGRSNIPA